MAIFSISQNAGCRHLEFLKFENFNGRKGQGVKLRHVTKISWRSDKPLRRYDDFSIFQDADCRYLEFF